MRKINRCFSFVSAALLVACATQAPPTQTQTSSAKFEVPAGYHKAMMNGEVYYCRNDVDSGSHLSRNRVCYTVAQMQTQDADNQNDISNQIQNANSAGAGRPTAGR
jgi:hypothetical protein